MARVSNPENQNSNNPGLIKYLINSKHWSPFEMVNMVLEVETSRAIAAQILRHRSFSFQEFSQRYQDVTKLGATYEHTRARRQDTKNRQSSLDNLDDETIKWFDQAQAEQYERAINLYKSALLMGISKEQARLLLPLQTTTRMYINGTVRSWIHYFQARTAWDAQLEHREVALAAQAIFIQELPITSQALGWNLEYNG